MTASEYVSELTPAMVAAVVALAIFVMCSL